MGGCKSSSVPKHYALPKGQTYFRFSILSVVPKKKKKRKKKERKTETTASPITV